MQDQIASCKHWIRVSAETVAAVGEHLNSLKLVGGGKKGIWTSQHTKDTQG